MPLLKKDIITILQNFTTEPRVDVYEKDNSVEISAELAGVKKEDIDISFSDGYLTIEGEKKTTEKTDKEKDNYHINERWYGMLRKSIYLGDRVDVDNAKAKFENGVLSISLPKKEPSKKNIKKIKISS